VVAGLSGVGIACVLCGTGGWGLLVARQLRRRPLELAGLQAALEALRTEIEYGRTPLPQALRRAAAPAGGPAGELLVRAAAILDGGAGASAGDAWEGALAEVAGRSAWSRPDLTVIARLGATLGASAAADQVRHLALAVRRLRAAESEAAAQAERQARMWLYLGLLGGAALILAAL
jgi:stage III sporulation protein AB